MTPASSRPRRVRIGGDLYHSVVPDGAVRVDRRTRYGNPHRVTDELPAAEAVARYRDDLVGGRLRVTVAEVVRDLAGRDLACWCRADAPCHADVLLAVANGLDPLSVLTGGWGQTADPAAASTPIAYRRTFLTDDGSEAP